MLQLWRSEPVRELSEAGLAPVGNGDIGKYPPFAYAACVMIRNGMGAKELL
jgi:hypothetical protein